MADPPRSRFAGSHLGSQRFEDFVDNILDDNVSEVDASDDEDDLDVDPTFEPDEEPTENTDSENEEILAQSGDSNW
ncbi:hypothetical protein J6590_053358 [Homalodisca vitripennis]|nr:hypothetical protein J6590_053358 [Homalodisca vitripennis]